ncbi:MAG: hypothetical protein P8Y58_04685 [Novosphingobium sp.]
MRTARHTRTAPATLPLMPAVTFICTACKAVEHRRTAVLPEHWATETIGDDIYAYCPDCAADLPCGDPR